MPESSALSPRQQRQPTGRNPEADESSNMSTKTATIGHNSNGEIVAQDADGNLIASKRRTNNPAALAKVISDTEIAGYVIDWTESTVAKPESTESESLIVGRQVQIDRSGQGQAWRDIDAQDIPVSVREEIEGEMIDGGVDDTDLFVASNGQHYRW
jgi:hypothetical protein